MAEAARIAVYLPPSTVAELEARGWGENRSGTISRDLERLYGLYRRALRRVRLTVNEAIVLCSVVNGTSYDANTAHLLWAAVEDAGRLESLGESHGVDAHALAAKLRALGDLEAMAVVDAAERALAMASDLREAVVKVGLASDAPGQR